MKNERGAIKLITLIGIILILTLVLFVLVVWDRMNKRTDSAINNTTNTSRQESETEKKESDNSDFNFSFLKMENNKNNMIYSPLSIKYALKMLQEGANGETYNQIENVVGNLNLPNYKNIDKTLSLANGIFIRDTYYSKVKQTYKDILVNKYNAEINKDAFANANNINSWIENKTL